MRILILNWKDIRHIHGGAEVVTHQFAKQLVAFGHTVVLFTAKERFLPPKDEVDGVHIVRAGNTYTVYIEAFLFYQKNKKNFDIVVDQIHGIPFFTPLYVRKPIIAYIHEVAGVIWFKEWNWLIARLGNLVEHLYFYFYKNTPFLTHTISTQKELEAKGITRNQISVIPLAIDPVKLKPQQRKRKWQILYVGRLSPLKQVDILIQAMAILKCHLPHLSLIIAGRGKKSYENYLHHLTLELHLLPKVSFLGFISEKKKNHLFAQSLLNIQPSLKEGFGYTVLEAAVMGTPTISFNVPGLRNVVIQNQNGMLVETITPEALAEKIETLVKDLPKLHRLQQSTKQWATRLPSWKQQSKHVEKLLLKYLLRKFAFK